MCGLAGLWEPRGGLDEAALHRQASAMAAAVAHRGPDDDGTWAHADLGVGLGHRRLAVVDLSPAGHQPMVSSSGRWVLVYNGEVYNHPELRALLDGVGWRGHSDTEVLLELIAARGPAEACRLVEGMFAWAALDLEERQLWLARDRLGQKPLYWGRTRSGGVAFGSELSALLAHPGVARDVDPAALAELLDRRAVGEGRALLSGTHKLPPGTLLSVAARDDHLVVGDPTSWWDARARAQALRGTGPRTPGDAEEALAAALRRSVARRRLADVPVGALLSSGVDSAAVVAFLAEETPHPIATFTAAFDDGDLDESAGAARIARHLGAEHHTLPVSDSEARALVPELPRLFSEPLADPSAIPTALISRLARRHVTVVLSGDGADELLGGYTRYAWTRDLWRRLRRTPAPLRGLLQRGLARLPLGALDEPLRALRGLVPAPAPSWARYLDEDSLRKGLLLASAVRASDVYRGLMRAWWPEAVPLVPPADEPGDPLALIDELGPEGMLVADLVTYLPDEVLVKVDRASMACGLEVRSPFLDREVVELCLSLPFALRFPESVTSGRPETKPLLRHLLRSRVPPEALAREKKGFGVPLASWLRGPLRDWADALLAPRALADGGLDANRCRTTWDEHLEGVRDHTRRLWPVLVWQAWRAHHLGAGAPRSVENGSAPRPPGSLAR